MDKPKDTASTAEKQPPNGFGRIPDALLPKLYDLTNLEARLFLVFCVIANRYREPLGGVGMSVSEMARRFGTSRGSIRRALVGIERAGLILPGSPRSTSWITVIHYLDHEDPPPGSPRSTKTPQLSTITTAYEPLIGSEDAVNVVDVAAASNGGKKGRKAPVRKRLKPWLYWDVESGELRAQVDDPRCEAFTKTWTDRLGNEERIFDELAKAERWLADNPSKRTRTKSFERFFGNWLGKLMEED